MITQEKLKERLDYNPSTGMFTWKEYPSFNKRWKAGTVAGTRTVGGYIRIKINNQQLAAHRLAWLYMNGEMPTFYLDHINRDKADNRISNLRQVNNAENGYNRSLSKNNSTGYTGVCFDCRDGKWKAAIKKAGKTYNLGYYDSAIQAAEAYKEAKLVLHVIKDRPAAQV